MRLGQRAAASSRRGSSSTRRTPRACSSGSSRTGSRSPTTAHARSRRTVTYTNQQVAAATTDSLQLFLNEAGPLPAADGRAGGRAREAGRGRRQGGQGPARQLEPAARRLDREAVPGPRLDAARPDPGRDHRADPRRREVRLAEGLQVLDVRDVVDPAGGAARRREQGAHHPDPRAHRRARAEDHPSGADARREARARAHRRRARRSGEAPGEAGARGARRRRAPSRHSTSRSAKTSRHRSATCSRATRRPPDEQVEVELTERALHDAVAELPEREQEILNLRYGLCGTAPTRSRSRRSGAMIGHHPRAGPPAREAKRSGARRAARDRRARAAA